MKKAKRKAAGFTAKRAKALAAKCPTCHAKPGQPCKRADGKGRMLDFHRLRLIARPARTGPSQRTAAERAAIDKRAAVHSRAAKRKARSRSKGGGKVARHGSPPAFTIDPKLIKVGERHRKDFGDLKALARSIDDRGGLLQPIAITTKRELIAGERRLRAWALSRFAGQPIPAHYLDVDAIVAGEYDENAQRKDFTPSEAAKIGRTLERVLRDLARRQDAARPSATRAAPGRKAQPGQARGRVNDQAAAVTGVKRRSLEKATAVVEAAERDQEKFGDLVEQMDRSGSIDAAYKKLKVREAKAAINAAPPALPMNLKDCGTVVIDFPWAGEPDAEQDSLDARGRAFRPYPEMSHKAVCHFAREQIAPNLAATVSVWLWATNFIIVRGYLQHVIAALGFKPENASTMLSWGKDKIGRGKILRDKTEHAILLTRGNPVIDIFGADPPSTLLLAPRDGNSRKPKDFYLLAQRVTPAKRYAEIFSTGAHGLPDWDCHGDQVGKFAPAIARAAEGALIEEVKSGGAVPMSAEQIEVANLEAIAAGDGREFAQDYLEGLAGQGLIVGWKGGHRRKPKPRLTKAGQARLAQLSALAISDAAAAAAPADELGVLEQIAQGFPVDYADAKLMARLAAEKLIVGKKEPRLTKAGKLHLDGLRVARDQNKALAAFPDDLDQLVALYGAELRKRHDAILACDEIGAGASERTLDLLQIKAHGRERGMGCDNSPAERLRAENAAPLGHVPLWGQRGIFELDIDGVPYLVAHDDHMDFAVFAEDARLPFVSETGYRSLMGDGPGFGRAVDADAEAEIRDSIKFDDTSGAKPKPRKSLPLPSKIYRMPLTWGEADEPVVVSDRGHRKMPFTKNAFEADSPGDVYTGAPAPAGHTVTITVEHVSASKSFSVATCACGWSHKVKRASDITERQAAAIEAHWKPLRAAAAAGLAEHADANGMVQVGGNSVAAGYEYRRLDGRPL